MLPITALPAMNLQGILGRVPVGDSQPKRTFAQIYKDVENQRFDSITDLELSELDYSELNALDTLAERKIVFYRDLARQQAKNPKFKPPAGVTDQEFRNVVPEYVKFRVRLERDLHPAERRQKAKRLITPWLDAACAKFALTPIGAAISNTRDVTAQLVEAILEEKDLEFSDAGLMRLGYLNEAGYDALDNLMAPAGTPEEAQIEWFWRMLRTIRGRRTILPLDLANAIVDGGSGDVSDPTPIYDRAKRVDGDIQAAAAIAQKDQVAAIPYLSTRAICARAIFHWMKQLSDANQNPRSVYGGYAEFLKGTAGSPI